MSRVLSRAVVPSVLVEAGREYSRDEHGRFTTRGAAGAAAAGQQKRRISSGAFNRLMQQQRAPVGRRPVFSGGRRPVYIGKRIIRQPVFKGRGMSIFRKARPADWGKRTSESVPSTTQGQLLRKRVHPRPHDAIVPLRSFADDLGRKLRLRRVMKTKKHDKHSEADVSPAEKQRLLATGSRLSKEDDGVNYKYATDPERSCIHCTYFRAPGKCVLVSGLIRAIDTCDLFEALQMNGNVVRASLVTLAEAVGTKTSESAFSRLSKKLGRRKGVGDPDALAAWIGRKKYGAKGMTAKSRAGRAGEDEGAVVDFPGERVHFEPHKPHKGELDHPLHQARRRSLASEVAPPGWEGTVKAMKKHKDITNPWALSWWMKGRGATPHRGPRGGKKKERAAESVAVTRCSLIPMRRQRVRGIRKKDAIARTIAPTPRGQRLFSGCH